MKEGKKFEKKNIFEEFHEKMLSVSSSKKKMLPSLK